MNKEVKKYHYFDTPDGHDVDKKLWFVIKPLSRIAALIGIGDVLLWSHPKGSLHTAARFAGVAGGVLGIASTFVITSNSLASIRGKDDRLNWFLGGFAAGAALGATKGRAILVMNYGMFGGIVAFLGKDMKEHGYDLGPTEDVSYFGGPTTTLADFTLTAERPRGWTTGK